MMIEETQDYEALVDLFMRNELEFSDEEPVPTDLVKCWKLTGSDSNGNHENGDDIVLMGGAVLAKREGGFILDGIAVEPHYRKLKVGKMLLEKVIEEVKSLGGKQLFLVARAPDFFRKYGFVTVPKAEAPNFFECLTCPQYDVSCHPEVMCLNIAV